MFNHCSTQSNGMTSCGHSIENAVLDHKSANAICTICGQVLDEFEHNFYGNTVSDYHRVGISYNDSAWKKYEPKEKADKQEDCISPPPSIKLTSDEKRKIQTFDHIDVIVNQLRLTDEAVDLAKLYYDKIDSLKYKRCKKVSLLAAACISLVIKTRRINITFKELAGVCDHVKTKEVMRLNHIYSKLLSLKKHYVSLSDTISKYAAIFCLDFHQEKFSFALAEFIQNHEIIPGSNPFSCISVIMYCTCFLIEPSLDKHIAKKRKAVNWKVHLAKFPKPHEELNKIVAEKLDISINTIRKSLLIFKDKAHLFFTRKNVNKFSVKQTDINFMINNIK